MDYKIVKHLLPKLLKTSEHIPALIVRVSTISNTVTGKILSSR